MLIGVIALVVVVLALLALGLWLDAVGERTEERPNRGDDVIW